MFSRGGVAGGCQPAWFENCAPEGKNAKNNRQGCENQSTEPVHIEKVVPPK
jgi:hypothetical protein